MSEKRSYYYIAVILLIITLTSISFAVFNSKSALSSESLEECKSYAYNGENKINILFFGEENKVDHYSEILLNTEPYNENKDSFNIYYIDSFEPECDLYKEIAILCDSMEMRKKAASCPSDLIIVLDEKSIEIRSSAYNNLISLNTNQPDNVLIHEMGHAIANLAEEYINGKNPPRGSKNCKASCESFEEKDGCYEGCSQNNLVRSVSDGVMRSLSTDYYGLYNLGIVRSEIFRKNSQSLLTGRQISEFNSCTEQESALVNINTEEVVFIQGCSGNGFGPSTFSVIKSGVEVSSGNYNDIIFTDAPKEEGSFELEGETYIDPSIPLFVTVPYISDKIITEDKEIGILSGGNRPCQL